jgi:hypothetical protein
MKKSREPENARPPFGELSHNIPDNLLEGCQTYGWATLTLFERKPRMPHLFCYQEFAVNDYGFALDASNMGHPRLS